MFRNAAILAVCLVATSASAQQSLSTTPETPKPVIPMEEPHPGDNWTYKIRDEITGKVTATRENVVTEVTAATITVRFRKVGASTEDGFDVYDRSWNVVEARPWRYSPNDGSGIQSPLEVGKKGPVHR